MCNNSYDCTKWTLVRWAKSIVSSDYGHKALEVSTSTKFNNMESMKKQKIKAHSIYTLVTCKLNT